MADAYTESEGPEPRRGAEERLEAQRRRADSTKQRERERAEEERGARRTAHDQTRHHARGSRQEHESVERERRHDDAELERERALSDDLASLERSLADDVISRQAGALAAAGASLREPAGEVLQRVEERRVLLEGALTELARLEATTTALLREEPSGPGGVLTERVDAVRTGMDRVRRAIERALALR